MLGGTEAAERAEDPIHVLNSVERAGLQRVARGAVLRAALAGVINAIATGLGELYAIHHFGPFPEPSAALELLDAVFEQQPTSSPALMAAMHHAVGSAIVRTRDLHPNHVAMLRAVRQRLGEPPPGTALDDSGAFLKTLPVLELDERRAVPRVLAAAAILDGRLARAERRLLAEAYAEAGIASGIEHVEQLRRAFVAGDAIPREELLRAAA